MKTYCNEFLKKYLCNDWIMDVLKTQMDNTRGGQEKNVRYNKWLYEMDNKRMIYADVYGDLLKNKTSIRPKVIDVGGGYTSLTHILASNCEYTLLDFLAHGGDDEVKECVNKRNMKWINMDWNEAVTEKDYDIVIANDIFPHVDQRMEMFIDKFLPICKEIRLIITYYNNPKYYATKRIDDPEIMTFLSWDGEITGIKLKKYYDRLINTSLDQIDKMKNEFSSIYKNGRQVSYVRIKGDIR